MPFRVDPGQRHNESMAKRNPTRMTAIMAESLEEERPLKRATKAQLERAARRIADLSDDARECLREIDKGVGWDGARASLAGRDLAKVALKLQRAIAAMNAL